jgi:hypothetical protein
MLYTNDFMGRVLFDPIREGADKLKIISGYATPTMVSYHIKEIMESFHAYAPIDITLIIGMCKFDGLTVSAHEGFKCIVARNNTPHQSQFMCQYVINGTPIHSKIYLWEKQGIPFRAFVGSANYTQTAFSSLRRELIHDCDPFQAQQYFDAVERDTIYCNHAEVEEYITLTRRHPILDTEELTGVALRGVGMQSITLSLLSRNGETGTRSGLNWGQRAGREPNQSYIPLPAEVARSGFFPLEKRHFSVLTDDGVNLILRVEQQNDKAITTPLNNSLLGEYFRNRLELPNGAYVDTIALRRYGRADVTFYKLDDEQFFMDFST